MRHKTKVAIEADFCVKELYEAAEVQITSSIDPISLQASPERKRRFQEVLGIVVKEATVGVYTHDVEVTLVWYIEEDRRYQTHLVADLDNVLKPILDAITGPEGILVDDNQIQSIKASWMTPGVPGPGFQLTFTALMPDDYVRRDGLYFVEFSPDRCYLMPGGLGGHAALVVSGLRKMLTTYRKLISLGLPEQQARTVLPIARPFPRARLHKFNVRHERDFPETE